MKGTIVYDVVTTIGIIILIFMVIYWSLVFGTDTVAGMLLTSPSVVQASLSSAFSFGCRTEDYDFTYIIEKRTRRIHTIPVNKPFSHYNMQQNSLADHKIIYKRKQEQNKNH